MIYLYVNRKAQIMSHRASGVKQGTQTTKLDSAPPGSDLDGRSASSALRSPLYHQIYLVLREQIRSGVLRPGDILPGEHDLASDYGVSRITVKRALNELAADGLVNRARGRGTQVVETDAAPALSTSGEGQLEDLLSMGLETDVAVLDFSYVPAPPEVAQALGCGAGEEVQRCVRVRALDNEPFSYLTTYIPSDIGHTFGPEDLTERPLLMLLEQAGVEVEAASQTVTATLADAAVAKALEMEIGSALLKVSRVVTDKQGRPVEYITALYRPDKYGYRMTFSRVGGGEAASWSPAGTGFSLKSSGEKA